MKTQEKTSHTEGPWKYEAETKTIRSVHGNYWLATMNSWNSSINNEANAQLMASAPELLEALKALMFLTELDSIYWSSTEEFKRAQKAIKKAEGCTQ